MSTAVVVGSGPNGLTAACLLARAGLTVTVVEAAGEIGGGTRSSELTPGLLHDHCSAVHPLGVTSPVFAELDLARFGLEWLAPEVDLAHPLDGGRAARLIRSLADTAAGLGADGAAWQQAFGSVGGRFDALADDALRLPRHLPRHPLLLARFGLLAAPPVSWTVRRWASDEARALFAGAAAHGGSRLTLPMSAVPAGILLAAAHHRGWPVARGGSRAIAAALAAALREQGGRIETGRRIGDLRELDADVVLFDTAPRTVLEAAGDRLPAHIRRAYRRYRHGPAAFKLDLAVEGGIPWMAEAPRRAGTVHVGGTYEQIAAAEAEVASGRMPARPFVLVAQQYLADPSRSRGDVHPVWAYAHVPNGWDGDATNAILDQLDRFAPGVRDRIVDSVARGPTALEADNENYVGGDIGCGGNGPLQTVLRPRPAINPYATGIPGVYLCSAATPPGAGVHGMCGANAAAAALRQLS